MILLLPPPKGSIGHESQWAGTGRTIKLSPSSSSFVVDPPRGLRGVSGGSGGGGDGRRRWGTHSQAEGRTSERATTVHYTLSERGESWGGVDGEGNRLFFLPVRREVWRERERERAAASSRPLVSTNQPRVGGEPRRPPPPSLSGLCALGGLFPPLAVCRVHAREEGGGSGMCARA